MITQIHFGANSRHLHQGSWSSKNGNMHLIYPTRRKSKHNPSCSAVSHNSPFTHNFSWVYMLAALHIISNDLIAISSIWSFWEEPFLELNNVSHHDVFKYHLTDRKGVEKNMEKITIFYHCKFIGLGSMPLTVCTVQTTDVVSVWVK